MPPKRQPACKLIDATLREGFQTPAGSVFNADDVKRIAAGIAAGGAEMIEVGHPSISNDAMRNTRSVVSLGLGVPVMAHARSTRPDILAVKESKADWVGIFIGVNEISRTARLVGRDFEELMGIIVDSVSYAKTLGLSVRFTVEDGSRTEWDEMKQAFEKAAGAGADRLCLADSVGVMEPGSAAEAVSRIKKGFHGVELEVHLHDDRGLATANALASVDAGADWVSVCVNGIGERCGITDHTVLAMNLSFRGQRKLGKGQAKALADVSVDVAQCSGQGIPKSRPVLGEYAFTHSARLHVLAVERDNRSYEWIDPGLVGREHETLPVGERDGD